MTGVRKPLMFTHPVGTAQAKVYMVLRTTAVEVQIFCQIRFLCSETASSTRRVIPFYSSRPPFWDVVGHFLKSWQTKREWNCRRTKGILDFHTLMFPCPRSWTLSFSRNKDKGSCSWIFFFFSFFSRLERSEKELYWFYIPARNTGTMGHDLVSSLKRTMGQNRDPYLWGFRDPVLVHIVSSAGGGWKTAGESTECSCRIGRSITPLPVQSSLFVFSSI